MQLVAATVEGGTLAAADTLVVAEDFAGGTDMAWGSGLALGIMAIPTTHSGMDTVGTITPIPLTTTPMANTALPRPRRLPIQGLIHMEPVDRLKPPMKPLVALHQDNIGTIAIVRRAITLT